MTAQRRFAPLTRQVQSGALLGKGFRDRSARRERVLKRIKLLGGHGPRKIVSIPVFPPRIIGEGDREAVEGPTRGNAAVFGTNVFPQPAAAAPSTRTSSAPLPRPRQGRKRRRCPFEQVVSVPVYSCVPFDISDRTTAMVENRSIKNAINKRVETLSSYSHPKNVSAPTSTPTKSNASTPLASTPRRAYLVIF
jgi:hypothetical protein